MTMSVESGQQGQGKPDPKKKPHGSLVIDHLKVGINHIQGSANFKRARRWIIFLFGILIVLTGIVMIVLPGPALLIIPGGLAILATEFVWARKLLAHFKEGAARVSQAVKGMAR